MEFEVQLALPAGKERVVFDLFLQTLEELACKVDLCIGKAWEPVRTAADQLQMLGGGTSASVTEAKGENRLLIELLLAVSFIGTGDHGCLGVADVGSIALAFVPLVVLRGKEVAVDLGAVDAAP